MVRGRRKNDETNVDAGTAALIEQAHQCRTLPRIEDCLPYHNISEMWSNLVGRDPDRPWMTYYPCDAAEEEPLRLTLRQFCEQIDRATAVLAGEYGVGTGSTVGVMSISQPLTAAIYFAVWRLGGRVVPISPAENDERIGKILAEADASLLILHSSCRGDHEPFDSAIEAADRADLQRALVLDGADRGQALVAGWEDLSADMEEADVSAATPTPEVSWDADALVVYPSGATGAPVGVVLTQKQLLAAAYGVSDWHAIRERTVLMSMLPLHRASEIILALITPAFVGAQIVLNRRFNAEGFWRKMTDHNVAVASVIPKFLHDLLASEQEYGPERIPNFSHFICRSQPLTVEAAGEFQDRFGLKIVHGYGLNETGCYSCFLPTALDWHDHVQWICEHEVPSVGVPIMVNDVDVHDHDGRSLEGGRRGEIVARGHNIMAGYLRNPQANARAFRHGWLHSGYEGFKLRSEDGQDYFFVTGPVAGGLSA